MNLNDYQKQAMSTAVYPEQYKIAYPTLGFIEEVEELLDVSADDKETMIKEMGDVCWYAAAVATDLGLELEACYDDYMFLLEDDVEALFIQSCKIAGRVKKILRGDKDVEGKRKEIGQRLGDVLRRLSALAGKYADTTLEEVLRINLEKLAARQERGTLKGDGDNR